MVLSDDHKIQLITELMCWNPMLDEDKVRSMINREEEELAKTEHFMDMMHVAKHYIKAGKLYVP
jgi:hypothetical protein